MRLSPQSRCEKLVTVQLEMDNMRDTVAQLQSNAPDFLGAKLERSEAMRRDLEREARRVEEAFTEKKQEVAALEELVTRYQLELSSQASQASASEHTAEMLAAAAGVPVEDEVFECQRHYNLLGWSEKLLPTDRCDGDSALPLEIV